MSEKIVYNIKNVRAAEVSVSEAGVVTYGVPRALPGATEIALPPVGDAVKRYADGVVYVNISVNQGYDGTLSLFNIPDWFAEDFLGMKRDANGVLVENASAVKKAFALLFEFDTDTTKTKRNVLYNCNAGRTDIASATKEETVDPQPFSIPLTASPEHGSENVKASLVGDSGDATWAGWFASVYIPSVTAQYLVTVTVNDGADPIADALVVCGGKFARTDAAGKAYFMHPAGTYDVLLSATDFIAEVDTVTVVAAAVAKTCSLVGV